MRIALFAAAVLLAACAKEDDPAVATTAPAQVAAAEPAAPATPPALQAQITGADMSPTDATPGCRIGLQTRGLNDAELDIILGPMAGVCPNTGVGEVRIREILDRHWTASGCLQHTPAEVLKTLESGACGGDAG